MVKERKTAFVELVVDKMLDVYMLEDLVHLATSSLAATVIARGSVGTFPVSKEGTTIQALAVSLHNSSSHYPRSVLVSFKSIPTVVFSLQNQSSRQAVHT
jgi:hypothetical protein